MCRCSLSWRNIELDQNFNWMCKPNCNITSFQNLSRSLSTTRGVHMNLAPLRSKSTSRHWEVHHQYKCVTLVARYSYWCMVQGLKEGNYFWSSICLVRDHSGGWSTQNAWTGAVKEELEHRKNNIGFVQSKFKVKFFCNEVTIFTLSLRFKANHHNLKVLHDLTQNSKSCTKEFSFIFNGRQASLCIRGRKTRTAKLTNHSPELLFYLKQTYPTIISSNNVFATLLNTVDIPFHTGNKIVTIFKSRKIDAGRFSIWQIFKGPVRLFSKNFECNHCNVTGTHFGLVHFNSTW